MTTPSRKIVQLKIELSDIDPPIWRRVDVPANFTLRRLHDVIQVVFDWFDYHLHQFEIGDRIYGAPDQGDDDFGGERLYNDRNVKLGALLDRGMRRFMYRYDFGDDWEHIVAIERMKDPEDGVEYPTLVDGARQAPPEDCGGPPGFEAFLEAMLDEDHEDHEEMMDWYGKPFDPNDMALETVKMRLEWIAASRRKGRAKRSRAPSKKVWTKRR